MKVSKKLSLALLSVALLGAGTSLFESQNNSASTTVQAAKKSKSKSKKSKKAKKSKKTTKSKKSKKSKKSTKSKKYKKTKKTTKSKKSIKKSKKIKTVSASEIYKALFGEKSSDPTLEKYRNSMVKVAQQLADKQNGQLVTFEPSGYYVALQATKNTYNYYIDYPMDTYGENPYIDKDDEEKIKKGHLVDNFDFFGFPADGAKNAPKVNSAAVKKLVDEDLASTYTSPSVGVKKILGKYYYWVYDDTDNDTAGEDFYHLCDLYPASDFKLVMKKVK